MKRFVFLFSVFLAGNLPLILGGCANIGRDFPSSKVSEIRLNQTTQAQVGSMFGPPWRVGIEDGKATWTYGKYHYSLFGESTAKDLVIRFDDHGIVTSYTFNKSADQD